jgi:hypothetical protein
MDLKITALIFWVVVLIAIVGIPFIKADKDERLMLLFVALLSMIILIKNLYTQPIIAR